MCHHCTPGPGRRALAAARRSARGAGGRRPHPGQSLRKGGGGEASHRRGVPRGQRAHTVMCRWSGCYISPLHGTGGLLTTPLPPMEGKKIWFFLKKAFGLDISQSKFVVPPAMWHTDADSAPSPGIPVPCEGPRGVAPGGAAGVPPRGRGTPFPRVTVPPLPTFDVCGGGHLISIVWNCKYIF